MGKARGLQGDGVEEITAGVAVRGRRVGEDEDAEGRGKREDPGVLT